MSSRQDKLVAAAMSRLATVSRQEALDPYNLEARPTPKQQLVINEFGKIKQQWIRAGNQCKPEYSQILMADGTYKPIGKVVEGDMVMAFDYATQKGVPSKVLRKWENGVKAVYRYYYGSMLYTDSTPNHLMPYHSGSKFGKRPIGNAREIIIAPIEVPGKTSTNIPANGIELLGYLIGDGCLTQLATKGLQFTGKNTHIVDYVTALVSQEGYKMRNCGNGDYFITKEINPTYGHNRYIQWIREVGLDGCSARDKFIPNIVFKSSIEDRRKFIAGLIATDGWVNYRCIGFCSTSKQLSADYLSLLRTIGLNGTLSVRKSNNPKHADLYSVEIKNGKYINKFHKTITVPGKPIPLRTKNSRGTKLNNSWCTSKIRRVEYVGELPVYDITIDHPDHVYICDGLATSNSGKSQTCARIVSWVVTDTHPTWKRPVEWSNEPLLVIVCGRTGKQIEDSLLPKIRGFLEPGSYKEVRIGNIIQRLELTNGNRIIFQSLENPTVAQERLQSYVAHVTWCDELPPTMGIVRELLIRVQARNGYFLGSFTPTVVNTDIQQYIDHLQEPEGKVYRFHMLDNPLYSDETRRNELLARYSHLPSHIQQAIFEGEWLSADDQVYYFNYSTMVEMPVGYSPMWKHVEAVDPATQSALGLTVWAEDPATGIWYCVIAEYLKGIYVPTEIIQAVQKWTANLNIVRRISDSEATWYIHQAHAMGIHYSAVYKKSGRKLDLIKQLQQFLGTRIRISPHCSSIIQELQQCRWSDRGEGKIINASSYHLLDSAQYFCDNIPKHEKTIIAASWDDYLYQQNEKRKIDEEKLKKKLAAPGSKGNKYKLLQRRGRATRGHKSRNWGFLFR